MPSGSQFPTIIKAIHQRWKELPAEGKKPYQDMCLTAGEQNSEPETVRSSECANVHLWSFAQQFLDRKYMCIYMSGVQIRSNFDMATAKAFYGVNNAMAYICSLHKA